jgi:hypothetical protein
MERRPIMLKKARLGAVPLVLLGTLFAPVVTATAEEPIHPWQPRISVVWPHDGHGNPTPVEESRMVNVSVWPQNQVGCDENPLARADGTVREFYLWMAKDNEPTREVKIPGQFTLRKVNGVCFPTVEYNNVPADLVAHPQSQYRFGLGLGPGGRSGIWVHAAEALTYKPEPVVPTGYAQQSQLGTGGSYDSYIQIVWPHDEQGLSQSVESATFVNIAVDIFVHGTKLSVPPDFEPGRLSLKVYTDDGPMQVGEPPQGLQPEKMTYTANGLAFPRWVFNNVPVEPGKRYHFLALVYHDKIESPYSTIWTHAADPRTYLPVPPVPPPCLE